MRKGEVRYEAEFLLCNDGFLAMSVASVCVRRKREVGAMIHVSVRRVFSTFGMYLPTYLPFNSGLPFALANPLDPPRGNDLPPVRPFLRILFNDRY